MVSQFYQIILDILKYLGQTLATNWFVLLLGITIAVVISVYVDAEKTRNYFLKRPRYLILSSVMFGALTPFCACGTMAVVISLISSSIPWGAIMAFLVSSPLMSPDMFVMLLGFLGLNFTIALLISSIVLGLGAGWITHYIETRTTILHDQLRLTEKKTDCCKCNSGNENFTPNNGNESCYNKQITSCCNISNEKPSLFKKIVQRIKLNQFLKSFYELGFIKIMPLFLVFVIVAYVVKEFVPTSWIVMLFSGEHFYSVPLAALIGFPMYVSDSTVLPLLQVLKDAGASHGAILAYMISGPATSLGVIGGLTLIMKRKAVVLYAAIILVGAIALGYTYDFILSLMQ